MPDADIPFSHVNLIRSAIEGKDLAVAAYDGMLWRIRAGYAAVLYGAFTLVVALADRNRLSLTPEKMALIAVIILTGFTVCAVTLDFYFLRSKLRVVESKEALTDIAYMLASGGTIDDWKGKSINRLIHNSGEHKEPVRWDLHPSAWPIALLYLGTWGPLCLAVYVMAA
jgi:uncharacterized membrane protein YciS (DUF1049 family)